MTDIRFIATIGAIKTYRKDQVPDEKELDENGVEVKILKRDKDGNVLLKKNGEPQTMAKIKKRGHGSLLQRIQHNEVKEMTIHELANEIRQHHSFRASAIDKSLLKSGAYTVTDSLFKSFQLLAVDVDHGNMSLDELKSLLSKQSLNDYALIYPTLSSNDEVKRWRVVFVLDKLSTNKDYFEKLHAYLIYCLFEPYSIDLKTHKVDPSCKNVSRLFFTSKNGEITEEHDRTISFDYLLEKALEKDYVKIINEWASRHLELNGKKKANTFRKKDTLLKIPDTQVFGLSDLLLDDKTLKMIKEREESYLKAIQSLQEETPVLVETVLTTVNGNGETREVRVQQAKRDMEQSLGIDKHYLTEDLEKQIEDALIKYSYEVDEMWVDANETIEFINKLDLAVLLGVELREYIACPFHHENKHDSAAIFQTTGGITLFNCFSCGTQHTTFHFLHELYHSKYGDNYYQTVKRILRIMGLEIGSEYQKKAKEEISFSKGMIDKMSKHGHEFVSMLSKRNLLGLLDKIMYDMATFTCPTTPLTRGEQEMKSATIFASKEYILKKCIENKLLGNMSLSSVHRNINLLVKYGLLVKLSDDEINEEFLQVALKCRDKKLEKFEANKKTEKDIVVRRSEYYAVPYLSNKIINHAVEQMKVDEKNGMGEKKNMSLKVQTLANKEKAQKTYVQDEAKFTKEEKKFIKDAKEVIPILLDTAGYVSEKNILPYIDTKKTTIRTEVRKQKIAKTFVPAICASFNLVRLQATAETKKIIKLYEDYHYKEYIYIKE